MGAQLQTVINKEKHWYIYIYTRILCDVQFLCNVYTRNLQTSYMSEREAPSK